MANGTKTSQTKQVRRYRVASLLELAPKSNITHFDLAKFSFDAARAGIVPQLGACAMTARAMSASRSLSHRVLNRATSTSSHDESVLGPAKPMVNEPERQPVGPPAGDASQKDAGFAGFLKRHASPTHQRVTAGGRIVPMEQRPCPPKLPLQASKCVNDGDRKDAGADAATSKSQVDGPTTGVAARDTGIAPKPGQTTSSVDVHDKITASAGINGNLLGTADVFTLEPGAAAPLYLPPAAMPAPTMTSLYSDMYGMPGYQFRPSGLLPFASPFLGFDGSLGAQLAPPWTSATPAMPGYLPSHDRAAMTPPDMQMDVLFARKMLADATRRFEECDVQIKTLDRYRATHFMDPQLGEQRLAIAQSRGEARSDMVYWRNVLGEYADPVPAGAPGAGTVGPAATNSNLNVNAAAYVPAQVNHGVAGVSGPGVADIKSPADAPLGPKVKPLPKSGPRGIAILPPPALTPTVHHDSTTDMSGGIGSPGVDDWGVRIGQAPPEVARQQNELLDALVRKASQSPPGSTSSASLLTPGPSTKSSDSNLKAAPVMLDDRTANKLAPSDTSEWLPAHSGRAPATVEAGYETQLDALRLPRGIISKVRLPDGMIVEVRGHALQRPPSFEMDDFERRYWTSKPRVDRDLTTNIVEMRTCSKDGRASRVVTFDDLAHFGLESDHEALAEAVARQGMSDERANKAPSASPGISFEKMSHAFGRKAYKSLGNESGDSDPSVSTLKYSTASSPVTWTRADKTGWPTAEPSRASRDFSGAPDGGRHKGLSSVSVQSVHAMGRLPHLLDGATEGQRFSARSMLSAAGKARSPAPQEPRPYPDLGGSDGL